jgi:nucleotide-binding universal stress UspA family protein
MQRFRNILVVHDPRPEERSALDRALELARRNQARITLFEAIEELPWEAEPTVAGVDLAEAVRNERIRQLEEIVEPLRREGHEVDIEVRAGKPFVEVVRAVLENGHDLVLKTARGDLGLTGRLFGTTALHLMRKCPCPVWVVRPGFRSPHRRILAAVDPLGGPESLALDRKILELATSLARIEESELHVVHAWRIDDALRSGRLPRDYVDDMIDRTRTAHEVAFRDLLAPHDAHGVSPQRHFEEGAPDRVIVSKVREVEADLVVLGTVGRTGIAGFFIGGTAEEVLQRVDCSVLTVKPEGFVSPITRAETADTARS